MKNTLDCVQYKLDKSKIIFNGISLLFSIFVLILTPQLVPLSTSAAYLSLMSIGIVGVFIFGINIMFRNKSKIYLPTGSSIKQHNLQFGYENSDTESLQNALNSGDFQAIRKLTAPEGLNTMVNIMYSKDGQFAAYQMSRYNAYQYQVITEWNPIQNFQLEKCLGIGRK